MSYDGRNQNGGNSFIGDYEGESGYLRSLKKADINGASPQKFKHRPRRYFVDRQEIKTVFNQKPGKYHGFLQDFGTGGTFTRDRPDKIFKWSLGANKKDIENMHKFKDESRLM